MPFKLTNKRDLLRYFVLPLLLAVAIGWLCAPKPGNAAGQVAEKGQSTAGQAKPAPVDKKPDAAASVPPNNDLQDRVKSLEEKEQQAYLLLLEGQRKSNDWLFSFLAWATGVVGIFGAFIPFIMGKNLKDEQVRLLDETKRIALKAERTVSKIKERHQEAERHSAAIQQNLQQSEKILANSSVVRGDFAQDQAVSEAAEKISNSPDASYLQKTRAKAIQASLDEDFAAAQYYWRDLTEADDQDAQAWFGWGVCLHELANREKDSSPLKARLHWQSAAEKYEKALSIKHDYHEAANNWGNALNDEAQAIMESDVVEAQRLLQLAGQHYHEALSIKPDSPEAAYNLGNNLAAEARSVVGHDVAEARRLWQLAGQRFQQTLSIKQDKHEAANNWGIALDDEAHAVVGLDLAEARRLWQLAGQRYQQGLSSKADDHKAANNWGNALAAEASAVLGSDLAEARRLWRLAGERYQQALTIKQDKHEAANNWGNSLAAEARAVLGSDLAEAHRLWRLAGERYQQALSLKPDLHKAAHNWVIACISEYQVIKNSYPDEALALLDTAEDKGLLVEHLQPGRGAYNLACIAALRLQSAKAVAWLEVCAAHNSLESQERVAAEPDFEGIRKTPEFTAWWAKTFPGEAS